MVAVVVIEFGGMRCQPLRRALCEFENTEIIWSLINLYQKHCA
ncbi:acetyltransferase [Vibrio cholerae]|nr:acetyltransferase [Vibrio cholerae]TYA63930.1 acetyltransferase [Vibrio cholerae]